MQRSSWTRLVGGIVLRQGNSTLAGGLLLVVTILVAWEGYVVATMPYTRQVNAGGEIRAPASTIELSAPQDGVLAGAVPVTGQTVRKGETVFIVESATSRVGDFGKLADTLESRIRQTELSMQELKRLRQQLDASEKQTMLELKREEQQLQRGLDIGTRKLAVLNGRLDRIGAAASDFSVADVDAARLEVFSQQAAQSSGEATRAQLAQRMRSTAETHSQRVAELVARERALAVQLETTQAQSVEQAMSARASLQAPAEGRIAAVQVRAGQTVQRGQVLAVMRHGDAAEDGFSVRLLVKPASLGAVAVGADVSMEVDSFPAREFGLFRGQVTSIVHMRASQDKEPAFAVDVALMPRKITQFGRPVSLTNGMSVKAAIVTDRLTLLEWLLEPVLITFKRRHGESLTLPRTIDG